MAHFSEKSMEKAFDEAASGHGMFMAGERPVNYGGGVKVPVPNNDVNPSKASKSKEQAYPKTEGQG